MIDIEKILQVNKNKDINSKRRKCGYADTSWQSPDIHLN